jgi:hypothetical protein
MIKGRPMAVLFYERPLLRGRTIRRLLEDFGR